MGDFLDAILPHKYIEEAYRILTTISPSNQITLAFDDDGMRFLLSDINHFVFSSFRIKREAFLRYKVSGSNHRCQLMMSDLMHGIKEKVLNPDFIRMTRDYLRLNILKFGAHEQSSESIAVGHPTEIYQFRPQPASDMVYIKRQRLHDLMGKLNMSRIDKVELRIEPRKLVFRGQEPSSTEVSRWYEFETECTHADGTTDSTGSTAVCPFGTFWVEFLKGFSRFDADTVGLSIVERRLNNNVPTKKMLVMHYDNIRLKRPHAIRSSQHYKSLQLTTAPFASFIITMGEAVGSQVIHKIRKNKKPGVAAGVS